MRPRDLLRKPVVSGCGETIGLVVDVRVTESGHVLSLRILENGSEPRVREVEAEHVLEVGDDVVRLKGPRQGYHIARLTREASVSGP